VRHKSTYKNRLDVLAYFRFYEFIQIVAIYLTQNRNIYILYIEIALFDRKNDYLPNSGRFAYNFVHELA
jgi:phosphate starvation-inducible membrane PsiE